MITGLHHLALTVRDVEASAAWYEDRADLDSWAGRLAAAAVRHSPVAAATTVAGAAVLVFRDPDNIQLELFFDPSQTGSP
jgi:catechol 2,3-dioxygenase-like lactoylglutathione lyase family enzyme